MRDAKKDAIEMAAQMRPYNEDVAAFAKKFHTVVRKARADGTIDIRVSEPKLFVNLLYILVSVAGKYAEGLVYPPHGEQDMTDGLLMLKRMIMAALRKGMVGTVGTFGTVATLATPRPHRPQSPHRPHPPNRPPKGAAR